MEQGSNVSYRVGFAMAQLAMVFTSIAIFTFIATVLGAWYVKALIIAAKWAWGLF